MQLFQFVVDISSIQLCGSPAKNSLYTSLIESDHVVSLQGEISANFSGENCLKVTHMTCQWKIILMNLLSSQLSFLGRGTESEVSFQVF